MYVFEEAGQPEPQVFMYVETVNILCFLNVASLRKIDPHVLMLLLNNFVVFTV